MYFYIAADAVQQAVEVGEERSGVRSLEGGVGGGAVRQRGLPPLGHHVAFHAR